MSTAPTTPLPAATPSPKVNAFLLIANAALAELDKIPVTGVVASEVAAQGAQIVALVQIYQAAAAGVKATTGQGIDLTKIPLESPVA